MRLKKFVKGKIIQHEICKESKKEEYQVTREFSAQNIARLTPAEIQSVINLWKPALADKVRFKNISVHSGGVLPEIGMFKKLRGFDARYLGHNMYLPIIAHKLNDYHYTKVYEDKNLTDRFLHSGLKTPKVFLRKINGEYFDAAMRYMTVEDAADFLSAEEKFVLKTANDSSGGAGVVRLERNDEDNSTWRMKIADLLSRRTENFVVQECVRQSDSMAIFNEASVNTFRVTTLLLHDEFSVLNIVFRTGKKGMHVDNWGAGGILMGVEKDGKMHDVGYDIHLNPCREYNHRVFSDVRFSFMPEIIHRVQAAHQKDFPLAKMIGWDICVDRSGEPLLLEVNSSQPGIIGEQLCNGPIFGERTQEVIDYCASKDFVYHRSLFRY